MWLVVGRASDTPAGKLQHTPPCGCCVTFNISCNFMYNLHIVVAWYFLVKRLNKWMYVSLMWFLSLKHLIRQTGSAQTFIKCTVSAHQHLSYMLLLSGLAWGPAPEQRWSDQVKTQLLCKNKYSRRGYIKITNWVRFKKYLNINQAPCNSPLCYIIDRRSWSVIRYP